MKNSKIKKRTIRYQLQQLDTNYICGGKNGKKFGVSSMNAEEEFEKGVLGAIKAIEKLQKNIPVGTVSYPSKLDDKYQEKLNWLGIAHKNLETADGYTFPAYRIFVTNTQVVIVLPNEAIRYKGNGRWEPMER